MSIGPPCPNISHVLYKTYHRHYRYGGGKETEEDPMMLIRNTDPFREFDRLTQQLMGSTNRPAVMPLDAWREGETFVRSEEHTSELQSLMRISYAVFCLKKKKTQQNQTTYSQYKQYRQLSSNKENKT